MPGEPEQYHHDVVPVSRAASSDTAVDASPAAATAVPSARPANLPAKLQRQVSPSAPPEHSCSCHKPQLFTNSQ